MFILLLLVAIAGSPILFLTFRAFDGLVLIQRTRHPQAWESDGRPRPFLSQGDQEWPRSFGRHFASQHCAVAWVFSTPEWARADPEGRRQLRKLRLLAAVWNLVVVPAFVLAVLIGVQFDRLR
jgi:hypothetical protein